MLWELRGERVQMLYGLTFLSVFMIDNPCVVRESRLFNGVGHGV